VLELLLPYLRVKRPHAELVLAFPLMPKGHFDPAVYARKLELLAAIRALNNRQRDKRVDAQLVSSLPPLRGQYLMLRSQSEDSPTGRERD